VLVPILAMLGGLVFASLDSSKQTLQAAQCLEQHAPMGIGHGDVLQDWHDYMPYEGSANGVDDSIDLSACSMSSALHEPTPLKDLYDSSPAKHSLPGQRSIHICPSAPRLPGSSSTPVFGADDDAGEAARQVRELAGLFGRGITWVTRPRVRRSSRSSRLRSVVEGMRTARASMAPASPPTAAAHCRA